MCSHSFRLSNLAAGGPRDFYSGVWRNSCVHNRSQPYTICAFALCARRGAKKEGSKACGSHSRNRGARKTGTKTSRPGAWFQRQRKACGKHQQQADGPRKNRCARHGGLAHQRRQGVADSLLIGEELGLRHLVRNGVRQVVQGKLIFQSPGKDGAEKHREEKRKPTCFPPFQHCAPCFWSQLTVRSIQERKFPICRFLTQPCPPSPFISSTYLPLDWLPLASRGHLAPRIVAGANVPLV